jgi:2',3'-cyclic-nucleotide 2'-phosphodiesterase (5'-nucleotidase family)
MKKKRKSKMKKLIALLLVIVFCFSGCDVIDGIIGELPLGGGDTTELPDVGDAPSGDGETDGDGEPDGGDDTDTDTTEKPDDGDSDCLAHADANDDGYCDYCRDSVIVIVDIYAINDLHGKVNASDSQPGLGPLTTYLKTVMGENTILLSTGDMWQGSSESNLTYGALVTDWMSEMGFVSMTIGNHEYDWGESYISANASIAEFPILAINVYDKSTGERAEYATPSVVVSRGGIEIGIIGAIGDCYSSISGDVSGGFEFKTGNELAALVKAESDRLRGMGVDFIVYSLHDGYGSSSSGVKNVNSNTIASYYQSVLSDGYVDLVFEAHTHQSYILLDNGGVYHLQGGGENKGISYAAISVNSANGNTKVTKTTIISQSKYQNLADDELVDRLLEEYAEDISGAYEVLGNNRKYRDDSEVEQLVADLYYEFGVSEWGDKYDIVLGGGFIRTRNPYNLYAGETTYSDIYSLLPFDNALVLCSIKGSDLKSKFINTSNSDYYICYGDYDISSIKDNATYYIVTDTYTSTYAPNRLTEVARAADGIYARDLVADFIKKGGWA